MENPQKTLDKDKKMKYSIPVFRRKERKSCSVLSLQQHIIITTFSLTKEKAFLLLKRTFLMSDRSGKTEFVRRRLRSIGLRSFFMNRIAPRAAA